MSTMSEEYAMTLDFETFREAVQRDAAIRRRARLQPVGGVGTKIYPSTYPKEGQGVTAARHAYERRFVAGHESPVWCVLLDSVQSQANRQEEALLAAASDGVIELPRVAVDFGPSGFPELGVIDSLTAPHRIFDAILRDSRLDGEPFMTSPVGKRLQSATTKDASALLEISPTSLLFGAWNSTGPKGGSGEKFARRIASEIVGVDVPVDPIPPPRGEKREQGEERVETAGRHPTSRIDPAGITLQKTKLYKNGKNASDWSFDAADLADPKETKPSEINHGNVKPSVKVLGVTMAYAEQVVVLTFAGLRRLHFGSPERTAAGRLLVGALGVLAALEQDARGYALRSRCDLVLEGPAPFELVHPNGSVDVLDVDVDAARELYARALANARDAGFTLDAQPLALTPMPKLLELVRASRDAALVDEATDDAGA